MVNLFTNLKFVFYSLEREQIEIPNRTKEQQHVIMHRTLPVSNYHHCGRGGVTY